MAKSKSLCFRIMNCAGGDSTFTGKLFPPEGKSLSKKCWLNLRKRSAEPRVLRTNAVSEPESNEYIMNNMKAMETSLNSAINAGPSEKAFIYMNSSDEGLPAGIKSQISAIVLAQNHASDAENIQDSVAITMQAAIRKHLAAIKLKKVKYAIKLQAAIRGYLVRIKAVGTLRCIQAIIKMQAIARARHAGRLQEKVVVKVDNKFERNQNELYVLDKGIYCDGTKTVYSTKKLLSNKFVQQLLVSKLKTRPIRIKCDPWKLDSVWKWLERWKTVIPSHSTEENDQYLNHVYKENLRSSKPVGHNEKSNDFTVPKSDLYESPFTYEKRVDLNASSESIAQFRSASCYSGSCISSVESEKQGYCMNRHHVNIIESSKQSEFLPLQTNESKGDIFNNLANRDRTGLSDTEAQNVSNLFSKPCNPAFSAAKPKFEELSSNSKCVISSFSSTFHLSKVKKSIETGLIENFPSHNPIIHIAASECGTEISISSTLDSPDRSETECGEIIFEIASVDKHSYSAKGTKAFNLTPLAQDPAALEIHNHIETDKIRISPHKNGNTLVKTQRATGSAGKLTLKAANDSVVKQSTEHLRSDSKKEKKRKSGGFARSDVEDEPRISINSSSSLPSYMQATKSARAKVHASNSPKLSFEMHDKDSHAKKRISFNVNNEKKDSSPPKQCLAQGAHQNLKSNGVSVSHASAERKWH